MNEPVIILRGVDKTLAALKEFDKDAVRKFNKVIDTALSSAEGDARDLASRAAISDSGTPMSGWRQGSPLRPRRSTRGGAGWPGWNTGDIRANIRKTRVQGKVRADYTTSAGALLNASAAGAIFEVAGRRSSGRGAGVQFIKNLNNRFGKASRDIWQVVDSDRLKIQAKVVGALREAEATLQKHLNREAA